MYLLYPTLVTSCTNMNPRGAKIEEDSSLLQSHKLSNLCQQLYFSFCLHCIPQNTCYYQEGQRFLQSSQKHLSHQLFTFMHAIAVFQGKGDIKAMAPESYEAMQLGRRFRAQSVKACSMGIVRGAFPIWNDLHSKSELKYWPTAMHYTYDTLSFNLYVLTDFFHICCHFLITEISVWSLQ